MPVILAALPELLIALVLTLLIWGARALFGQMINSFGSRIPFLGSVIATMVDAIVSDVVNAATAEIGSIENGVLGLILAPVYWVEHIIGDVMGVFDAVGAALNYIVHGLIPQMVQLAVAEASVLVARAVAQIDSLINEIYRIVQIEFSQVYATITAVEHAVIAYAQALFAAAEAYTTEAIRAETAFVESVEHALVQEIEQGLAAETAFVEAEFKAAVAYTTSVAASLTTDIEHTSTTIIDWTQSEIRSLVTSINAALTGTLATALAATEVVAVELETLEKECTDELCSGLSEAANLANGLMAQGWIAALLGYATWCATDPRAAGDATASVLAPIAEAAVGTVNTAASVF